MSQIVYGTDFPDRRRTRKGVATVFSGEDLNERGNALRLVPRLGPMAHVAKIRSGQAAARPVHSRRWGGSFDEIMKRGGAGVGCCWFSQRFLLLSMPSAAGMRRMLSRAAERDIAGLDPVANLADKVGCASRARRLKIPTITSRELRLSTVMGMTSHTAGNI